MWKPKALLNKQWFEEIKMDIKTILRKVKMEHTETYEMMQKGCNLQQ